MTDDDKQKEVDDLMSMLGAPPSESDLSSPSGGGESPSSLKTSKPLFETLSPSVAEEPGSKLDLIGDVDMNVRVELGRKRMVVQDILKLGPGAVVPLESGTADPLDIYVNNRLVARGEVLVVNDSFAVRITEVIGNRDSGAK